LKYCDQNAAHIKLEELIKMYPDNFVVTFQYAISCERIGQSKEAIAAYETALKLIPESSKALNIYVDNQINRVKIKGPSKYSGAPGLRYMLY
jgi:Tfp pilus assembly protein PilF